LEYPSLELLLPLPDFVDADLKEWDDPEWLFFIADMSPVDAS
jgi:hypothetical protein